MDYFFFVSNFDACEFLSSIDQSLSVLVVKLVTPKSFRSFSEVMFLAVLQQTLSTIVYILLKIQRTKLESTPGEVLPVLNRTA